MFVTKTWDPMEFMPMIKQKYLVLSSQGGVGKTSVIVNLALALSKTGMKVGLMDVNFLAPDVYRMLGLKPALSSKTDERVIPVTYSDTLMVASIESLIRARDEVGIWAKAPNASDIRRFINSVSWGNLDCLFIDTPSCPGEALLALIRGIQNAKAIIVTAPNKVSRDRADRMIKFLKKEKVQIFGWIENMRGYLCQHCNQRQEMFSSGSVGRAIFLLEIPFLGRIPIDPDLAEWVDSEAPFLEKYPKSEVAESCNLIIKAIMEKNFEFNQSKGHDLWKSSDELTSKDYTA